MAAVLKQHAAGRIWSELGPELAERIASYLDANEVVCSMRLVNKAAASQFGSPQHKKVQLSRPVPNHAFAWRWGDCKAVENLEYNQKEKLACWTAASGSVANLEVLRRILPLADLHGFKVHMLVEAAGGGQLPAARWLTRVDVQRIAWSPAALAAAAEGGHQHVCDYALARGCPWAPEAACAAARKGHTLLLDFLLQHRHRHQLSRRCVRRILAAVALGCPLPTLQRLYAAYTHIPGALRGGHGEQQQQQGPQDGDEELSGSELTGGGYSDDSESDEEEVDDTDDDGLLEGSLIVAAAAASRLDDWAEKVEWLLGVCRCQPTVRAVKAVVAARPALPTSRLSWLMEHGFEVGKDALSAAVKSRNVDALKYLLAEMGMEADEEVSALAVTEGCGPEVLQALLDVGCRFAKDLVISAVQGDHEATLAWLLDAGVGGVLTITTMRVAASQQSLPVLEMLLARGCPCNTSVFLAAAAICHIPVLERLAAHGCPWDASVFTAAVRSSHGGLAGMEWLAAHGCPWDAGAFTAAAAQESRKAKLKWLAAHGAPMGEDGLPYLRAAAGRRDFRYSVGTLRLLKHLGCPFSPDGSTFTRAVYDPHLGSCSPAVLNCLRLELGCPVDWEAARVAAAHRPGPQREKEAVQKWLKNQEQWEQEQARWQVHPHQRQRRQHLLEELGFMKELVKPEEGPLFVVKVLEAGDVWRARGGSVRPLTICVPQAPCLDLVGGHVMKRDDKFRLTTQVFWRVDGVDSVVWENVELQYKDDGNGQGTLFLDRLLVTNTKLPVKLELLDELVFFPHVNKNKFQVVVLHNECSLCLKPTASTSAAPVLCAHCLDSMHAACAELRTLQDGRQLWLCRYCREREQQLLRVEEEGGGGGGAGAGPGASMAVAAAAGGGPKGSG